MLLSCYRQGSIKTIMVQCFYGSRPSQTAHGLKVWERKWGADGGSGRLGISKTSYMVYLNIYLLFHFYNKLKI